MNPTNGKHLALLLSLYTGAPLFEKIRDGPDPFACLLFEADVSPSAPPGARLVDEPESRLNMELWLELLRFRKRVHGHAGVKDIWSGLMHRNVPLPVVGPTADALWTNFIDCAIADQLFLDHMCHCLARPGLTPRPHFYRDTVGAALRFSPHLAISCHDRMHHHQLVPEQAAASVFDHALHSRHPDLALEPFAHIYSTTSASAMYDVSMSSVCESSGFSTAIAWHRFFTQRDDQPSPAMMERPIVAHLLQFTSDKSTYRPVVVGARKRYDALQSRPLDNLDDPLLSRATMNTMVGNAHGIRQKALGDAFCARLFATSAFSTTSIIAGLRMLGLESIGSVALREIAVRAQHPSAYLEAVRALKKAGIAIQDSTYCRILENFANEDNGPYFGVILDSDQHPDSYDEPALQYHLFSSFYARGKILEANATLAALANIHSAEPETFMLNAWLRQYSKRGHRDQAVQTLQELCDKGLKVSKKSLIAFVNSYLGPRKRGHEPVKYQDNARDLAFVSNMLLKMLRRGQTFDQTIWREILKRHGMSNQLQALERLCFWIVACHAPYLEHAALAPQYTPRSIQDICPHATVLKEFKAGESATFLKQCFETRFIRAIIAWGFQSVAKPKPFAHLIVPFGRNVEETAVRSSGDIPKRWAWGVVLARKLRDSGIILNKCTIEKEVSLCLRHIFGSGWSSNPVNRTLRRKNRDPLSAYTEHLDEVWREPLLIFGLAKEDHSPMLHDHHRTAYHPQSVSPQRAARGSSPKNKREESEDIN